MSAVADAKRLVVKVGTSTLTYENGRLNLRRIESLVKVLSDLKNAGREIVLVTSGAIGVGAGHLGLKERPRDIGGKQAVCDALIDTYFTDLREQLIAIDESDPVLRLRRAGIIYREHALDAPGIYALVWMGQASDSAQHCLDAITQIIRYGQAASVFRGDDPHLIASSIWVSIHGFIQFELRSAQPRTRGRERVDRSYGYLLDLLIRGIQR